MPVALAGNLLVSPSDTDRDQILGLGHLSHVANAFSADPSFPVFLFSFFPFFRFSFFPFFFFSFFRVSSSASLLSGRRNCQYSGFVMMGVCLL